MNARMIDGLKPPTQKELLGNLRAHIIAALGVNGSKNILDHAVAQVCFELESIAAVLTAHGLHDTLDTTACGFALRAIIARLQLARDLQEGMWDPEQPEQTLILKKGGGA